MFPTWLSEVIYYYLHRLNKRQCILGFANTQEISNSYTNNIYVKFLKYNILL